MHKFNNSTIGLFGMRWKKTIPTILIALAIFVMTNPMGKAVTLPPGNTVEQWNTIAENTVVGASTFQTEGFIYMAYVSGAVYDALVSIEGGYEPYGSAISAAPGSKLHTGRWSTTFRHRQRRWARSTLRRSR